MAMSIRFQRYLDDRRIPYQMLPHAEAFTAPETAAALHVPGKEVTKTVIVKAGGRYLMMVLPAHERVDLAKVARLLNVNTVRLATESEMQRLFPDCEVGAEPPFGNLYGVEEYVDHSVLEDREVICPAGTHHEAIRMRMNEFMQLTHPTIADFHAGGTKRPGGDR
jgi:Ala-tRNA(Pro) deacylase